MSISSPLAAVCQSRASRAGTSILVAFCVHANAQAQSEGARQPESSLKWGLGLGVSSSQVPYLGASDESRVVPLLYVENSWLRVVGATADLKLARKEFAPNNVLSLTARIKYDGSGYEASDSPSLAGMDERKGGIWGGATLAWETSIVRFSGELLTDLSDNSQGQRLQLQADRRFGFGNFAVTPRIQAQWLNEKYVNYYYGVRSHEARPGRALYSAESAATMELGVRVDYVLRPKQSVFLDVSATSLPDEIKLSPIVGRSNVSRITVGYLHRF
jgi:outer membrane protein